jgi:predicted transglutaminase-like cysteine proteinase
VSIIAASISSLVQHISLEKLELITKKYGLQSRKRVIYWDKVVSKAKSQDVVHKLKIVNDFFNKIIYKRDIYNWNKKDYWASPFEFMGVGAGDCEDYAIAKYYTLKLLGVPEDKLRIMYVKLLRTKRGTQFEESHMVLAYYHKPNMTPIILDNVNKRLSFATKRDDLKPVYSFNALGLWKAQNKGQNSSFLGENSLTSWKDLMSRI